MARLNNSRCSRDPAVDGKVLKKFQPAMPKYLSATATIAEAVAACLGIRFVLSYCKGHVLWHAVACGIVRVLSIVVR